MKISFSLLLVFILRHDLLHRYWQTQTLNFGSLFYAAVTFVHPQNINQKILLKPRFMGQRNSPTYWMHREQVFPRILLTKRAREYPRVKTIHFSLLFFHLHWYFDHLAVPCEIFRQMPDRKSWKTASTWIESAFSTLVVNSVASQQSEYNNSNLRWAGVSLNRGWKFPRKSLRKIFEKNFTKPFRSRLSNVTSCTGEYFIGDSQPMTE